MLPAGGPIAVSNKPHLAASRSMIRRNARVPSVSAARATFAIRYPPARSANSTNSARCSRVIEIVSRVSFSPSSNRLLV
jgi:hypothetical protein